MNKCEWKDGKFYPCDWFDPNVTGNRQSCYCIACDEKIDKPEPEVIIKKSGGTWVARHDGVDYFCEDSDMYSCKEDIVGEYTQDHPDNNMFEWCTWWTPIKEVKIDDDTAKLRPMVVDDSTGDRNPYVLYAVTNEGTAIVDVACCHRVSNIRLATVEDLP